MQGYIFFVVFSVMICSTVSYHDRQYTPDISSGTNCHENGHHHHDHSHEHSYSQVERTYPDWQDMTERPPRSTNSNTKPIREGQYRHSEPLAINITLVPYPIRNTNTRKITQDPNPVKDHQQNGVTDVKLNLHLEMDSGNIVNINIIHEVFFGNITGNVHTDDGSKMIFPGYGATSHPTRKISSRNCTYGLCEDVDDYPAEKVKSLISRSKELKQYFEQIEVPAQIDFDNRFGGDGDPLCSTISHTVFPRSAKNTKDVELFLINVGEFKQGVIYETCANEDKPCSYSDVFPMGYTTTCKQKFTVRRLMAVAMESDTAAFDNFPMPACCVCTVKKNI